MQPHALTAHALTKSPALHAPSFLVLTRPPLFPSKTLNIFVLLNLLTKKFRSHMLCIPAGHPKKETEPNQLVSTRVRTMTPSRENSSCGRRRWSTRAALLLAITTTSTLLGPHKVAAEASSPRDCAAEMEDCQDDSTCLECYSVITPATRDAWERCISSVITDDPCISNGMYIETPA